MSRDETNASAKEAPALINRAPGTFLGRKP